MRPCFSQKPWAMSNYMSLSWIKLIIRCRDGKRLFVSTQTEKPSQDLFLRNHFDSPLSRQIQKVITDYQGTFLSCCVSGQYPILCVRLHCKSARSPCWAAGLCLLEPEIPVSRMLVPGVCCCKGEVRVGGWDLHVSWIWISCLCWHLILLSRGPWTLRCNGLACN